MALKRRFANPFELKGKWYKANLHAHTTTSDGRASPPDRVEQYRRGGYDVLALTDHNVLNDISSLPKGNMLLISGVEYNPKCPSHTVEYHLIGLNIPPGFKFKGLTPNGFIRKVRRGGGEVILGHPFWCGYQLENFGNLKGLAALEVYNSACHGSGRGNSENEWAHALDRGMILPAVATDDSHGENFEIFGGWTMLKMPSLGAANVMKAIRNGAFYASCGPTIEDFRIVGDEVRLRCSPAAEIHLVAIPAVGLLSRAEPGKTITSFTSHIPRGWFGGKLPYLRMRVTDTRGRMAWTNPIFLT